MTLEEFERTLKPSDKEFFRTKLVPALPLLIEQSARNDETVQFFLAKIGAAQELARKWRTEFPGSDVAERCASELESLVISPD
jgi:hypothetical protein